MRGFVLGTGGGGGLSPPPPPPDDVLLGFSSPAAVSPASHSPTQRPEGRHHIGRQSSPGRPCQPNHAAFTTTSPKAGCGRGLAETDTLGVAQLLPSVETTAPKRYLEYSQVRSGPYKGSAGPVGRPARAKVLAVFTVPPIQRIDKSST